MSGEMAAGREAEQRHTVDTGGADPADLRADGVERPFPCRVQAVIPAAIDTPMMEQWGIPAHLMMPPSAVAEMVRYLVTLHPAAFVPEMQIVPRLEPNFPR